MATSAPNKAKKPEVRAVALLVCVGEPEGLVVVVVEEPLPLVEEPVVVGPEEVGEVEPELI